MRQEDRVVIYNRCSTEEESQTNALKIQVEESREIAQSMGWHVVEQFVESQSGTTAEKRYEYQRLLNSLDGDDFDIVMVKSIDRLTRNTKDWYLFLDRLTSNQKRLYLYLDRHFYQAEDALLIGIKAILAEDFSRELSKKIKNAHRRRQEKKTGLNITRSMFGWNRIGRNQYEVNEEEAYWYRRAFQLAENGWGMTKIAAFMYEHGVRSKAGQANHSQGYISPVQWRKMLVTPRAHGQMVFHKNEYDFEGKRIEAVPKEDWISWENALPPIVTKEYQEHVLNVIKSRNTKRETGTVAGGCGNRYPLSGKIFCGICQSPCYRLVRKKEGRPVVQWCCGKHLRKASFCPGVKIDEITLYQQGIAGMQEKVPADELGKIEDEVRKNCQRQLLQKAGGSNNHENNTVQKNLQQEEIEKLEIKKEFATEKLVDGILSIAQYQKYIEKCDAKIQELLNRENFFVEELRLLDIDSNYVQRAIFLDYIKNKKIYLYDM